MINCDPIRGRQISSSKLALHQANCPANSSLRRGPILALIRRILATIARVKCYRLATMPKDEQVRVKTRPPTLLRMKMHSDPLEKPAVPATRFFQESDYRSLGFTYPYRQGAATAVMLRWRTRALCFGEGLNRIASSNQRRLARRSSQRPSTAVSAFEGDADVSTQHRSGTLRSTVRGKLCDP